MPEFGEIGRGKTREHILRVLQLFKIGEHISKFFTLNPWLQRKRLSMVRKYAKGTILDVGCGYDVQHLCSKGSKYVGVDINKSLLESLRTRYPWLTFLCVDVDNEDLPPLSDTKFDTILLVALIEHLANPQRILRQISRLLKADGKLVITTATPLGDCIHNLLALWGLTSKHALKDHKTFYSRQDLAELLTPLGFDIDVYQKFELGLNQLVVCKKSAG